MLKCPFCHFLNEDGALFCEQCKSDLMGAEPTAAAPESPALDLPPLIAEAVPATTYPAEGVPMVAEAIPFGGSAAVDDMPLIPIEPLAPEPVAATPIADPLGIPMTVPPQPTPPLPAGAADTAIPDGKEPRLVVLRGQRRNVEYPIYEGMNFIGRADDKPVDIDLEDQEPPDRVWCSRQHALISLEAGQLAIEDLNSANGTFVNRTRIYPGQKKTLAVNDIVQIGNVQLKVVV